jgi:hypothetical protein
MRLGLFKRSSHPIAVLLVLASLCGIPHRQLDDDACLPMVAGQHDASKHAIAPLAPVDQDGHGHCAICHWIRGLKPTFASTTRVEASLDRAGDICPSASLTHRAPCGAHLPARAPPLG